MMPQTAFLEFITGDAACSPSSPAVQRLQFSNRRQVPLGARRPDVRRDAPAP